LKLENGDHVRHKADWGNKDTGSHPLQMVIDHIDPASNLADVHWYRPDGQGGQKLSRETAKADGLTLYEPIMQFFRYAHLPARLQSYSKPFAELASRLIESAPPSPERSVALRKLLEAKDAAVRAALFEQ
jgi:hypothetical protein